ncbi:hypothetical protein AB1Y20_010910 [Prymnesium parvum]|uniref:Uncharacterized protein n=1 Tax=Prymnesium parvum TaxID=97485 RepID=A0AB34IT60_PRYPA
MQGQLSIQRARAALKRAQAHSAAACKAACQAAKEKLGCAGGEVLKEAEARLEGKRQRCASPQKERPPHFEKHGKYDMLTWLRTTGDIMNRRAVAPVMGVSKPSPPEGEDGALRHWRRGLVGCVCDWAAGGSLANVVDLVVRLINEFNVNEMVLQQLSSAEILHAKVDAAVLVIVYSIYDYMAFTL